jgi:sugar phosphate isomerase/epimerase
MEIGASTACFYPLETEKALKKVCEIGFKKAEVFINAPCELEEPFAKELNNIAENSGTDIISVHPFSSFLESSCIFGDYQRRFDDYIGLYQKTCHTAAVVGAKYVVIHGAVALPKIPIPEERYFERFKDLIEIGKAEGVTVCQENVNKFKSQSIDFCKRMRDALGSDYNMVFDIKQTVRAGEDTFTFLEEFKYQIRHLHISDNSLNGDCLPPGKGTFDFGRVKDIMDEINYDGDAVIEIYSGNYDVSNELSESKVYLEKLWQR